MANISVQIESPVKYYDFTDQHGDVLATLRFVPSDLDIFERHKAAVVAFEKMQSELQEALEHSESISEDESLSMKEKYAAELKNEFNRLFNSDTSGFFDIASPFTPMNSGKPWALVILESVAKIIEEETGKNLKAMLGGADKYTSKYKAAPGKYPFLP